VSSLLVRGGTVVDGTGGAASRADVRLRDGVIVEIGPGLRPARDGEDEAELDAGGAIVAPGFIETHTHLDPALFWDPLCDPMPQHGVTSVLIGNCSLSLAPVRPEHRDDMLDVFCYVDEVMTDDLPGGASRLRRPEGGYRATVVAGAVTQRDGELTGARPGTVLGR
jgi:N-acyl-D-amino-acid deacylase